MIEGALFEQFFQTWNRAGMNPAWAAFARIKSHQVRSVLLDDFAAPIRGAF
jgi:hypothetical protein